MKKSNKIWSSKKHFLLSVGVALVFQVIDILSIGKNRAESIGIIGGADGPTSIFLFGKASNHILWNSTFFKIFVVMLILYKPMKNIIEKNLYSK